LGEFAQNVQASYAAGGESLNDDEWSLTGRWTVRDERAVAGSDAKLKIAYRARDVYLVLGPEAGTARRAAPLVVQDGKRIRTITLKDNRLYVLRKGDQWSRGVMEISVPKGFAAYAFTFG
jgi:archaeosine-15-forming tRNA-guanine transglycosylase